jgi:Domain of unknown function (DUF4153)
VLLVMAVFIVALPFRGLSAVFDQLSAGATMLAMVAAGVTLVSVTIDRDDGQATGSAWLAQAARALAAILVIPAGLACYAVWLRVGDYGWTPERLFAACGAGIALVYALVYLASVLRGAGWMARLRQANIGMAGLVVLVAALWLTPVLNAERISAQSQAARFASGALATDELQPWTYADWGKPGAAFLAELKVKAGEPGQEALAAQLELGRYDTPPTEGIALEELAETLRTEMPLQPSGATVTRDAVLAAVSAYDLETWRNACRTRLPGGQPGCVMVVADLLPDIPGDEAFVYLYSDPSYGWMQGFAQVDGTYQMRPVNYHNPSGAFEVRPVDIIGALQVAPPRITPVTTNAVTVGEIGLRMGDW